MTCTSASITEVSEKITNNNYEGGKKKKRKKKVVVAIGNDINNKMRKITVVVEIISITIPSSLPITTV